ncbi:MAG: hypothetical protein IJ371_04810, partial [Clostridia bacterium]|nr:hypothetical protein [Clostridia bacterium]
STTGSEVGKFDISDRRTSDSDEFANFAFNKMQSDSIDGIAYPATPNSWTKSSNNTGYQLSGVVNLSDFDKVMAKYASSINTITTPSLLNGVVNNNVLMIYNGMSATQSYTSSSKTLSANKYYKITTYVNTALWDINASGATIVAKTGSNILGTISNIKTNNEWKQVELYINTSSNSVDLSLELSLGYGANTSSGYAFFDNILVEESDSAYAGVDAIDLNNPMYASTTGREYNVPVLYTGDNKGETTINAGIVDLSGDLKMIAESKREALSSLDSDNKKVLAIVNPLEQDGYYEYTSVLSYSFESSKYYKLSFALFTDGIAQEDKEEKYDNNVLAEGVNIELTNLENAKFNYIQSDGMWTTYEIYIGLKSSATSNLVFSLGSEFTGCYGKAFLGNIVLSEIEEADFTSTSGSDTILKVDTVEAEDEEDETTSTSSNNFNWAYIPTIATFAAIVIAVVGIFIRRNIKFKKRVKNGKAIYDRDITVMHNKYRRLALDTREKEIRELTKERDELVAMRVEYEDKYKDALSRLRSARLANRDGSKRHEIMAIEHEVKHISKEVARLGVQVNNYDSEIEFMQTEAYVTDLEKRMMREDNSSRNQLRKEAEMSDEERAISVAKREAKQQRSELKAKAKADKLADKQAKLKQEREKVQLELQQAKELDEKYVKEQELKQIRLQEEKLAKEQAKAERELQQLEQQRKLQDAQSTEQTDANNDTEQHETTDNNNSVDVDNVEPSTKQDELTIEQVQPSQPEETKAEGTEVEEIVESNQVDNTQPEEDKKDNLDSDK